MRIGLRTLKPGTADWLRDALREGALSRATVARQLCESAEHPLRHGRPSGCRLVYGIRAGGQDVGFVSFVAAPMRLGPRDERQGWDGRAPRISLPLPICSSDKPDSTACTHRPYLLRLSQACVLPRFQSGGHHPVGGYHFAISPQRQVGGMPQRLDAVVPSPVGLPGVLTDLLLDSRGQRHVV